MQSAVHKATAPEVVLKMVLCQTPGDDRHPAAHHLVQFFPFLFYQLGEIFYLHISQYFKNYMYLCAQGTLYAFFV